MKIYYYLIGIIFCLLLIKINVNAQNKNYYGFSKTYFYSEDSLRRYGNFFYKNLLLQNSNNFIINATWLDSRGKRITEWIKIDSKGNVLRRETDSIENSSYMLGDIIIAQNGSNSLFAPGWFYNKVTKISSSRIQKRDTTLNLIWEKDFSFGVDTSINKNTLLQLDDGSLIQIVNLALKDSITSSTRKLFIHLIKTDSLGNLIWRKEIDKNEWNNTNSAILGNDGNILFSSMTSGYGVSTVGAGFVMKIDTAGNKIWHKVYNLPDYNGLEKIIATDDGNYICAGWARVIPEISNMPNGAGRLLKIDEIGNIIWDKIIDFSDREESFRTLVLGNIGDIVAFGSTNKYYAYDIYNYEVGSTREPDGWAIRLDEEGNVKWSRVFGHNATPYAHEYLYGATALPDGGFIASGCTQIYDSVWSNDAYIYGRRQVGWVVKLDSMGCMGPGCPEMLSDYIDSMNNPKPPINHITEITLYPNPGKDVATLENKAGFSTNAYYYISDMQGKINQDLTRIGDQTQVKIDLRGHASGNYIIRVYHDYNYYTFKYSKTE
ncbi:MAG TPA: T9SS type A sorting domain-containing protein [Edaphocola sp.]|nr:T9SS type A sorting domain-containing protein [Edaphocola sp.]